MLPYLHLKNMKIYFITYFASIQNLNYITQVNFAVNFDL